ncbi:hypothetical protein [Pseudoalteromonas arabiensis]|uniref:hypothetical protein n=1 Tax=Pseudoalteromonas arabiensis TaxID=874454 RepID=UPI0007833BD3|nr:hypothetical protein [Pseudoalteromonas arabiensis]
MDLLTLVLIITIGLIGFYILLRALTLMVRWAKKAPKGAYLFMALFPLISLFPIPPPIYENVTKAKHQQRKKQKRDDDKDSS